MTGMRLTRLLKAHNIRDIRHVDSTLQLKTRLAFRTETRLVFVHHEFRLLLVGVDVFAAQKNALKQEDVVLETCRVSENLLSRLAQWKNNTYLSLIVLATISLDHCKGTKTKQVSERFHLERLPIINSLGEIRHRCSQVLLVNRLIRRIQHVLNGIDCMVDIRLEFFIFRLLAQLLWLCQFAD